MSKQSDKQTLDFMEEAKTKLIRKLAATEMLAMSHTLDAATFKQAIAALDVAIESVKSQQEEIER